MRCLRSLCKMILSRFKDKPISALEQGGQPQQICVGLKLCRTKRTIYKWGASVRGKGWRCICVSLKMLWKVWKEVTSSLVSVKKMYHLNSLCACSTSTVNSMRSHEIHRYDYCRRHRRELYFIWHRKDLTFRGLLVSCDIRWLDINFSIGLKHTTDVCLHSARMCIFFVCRTNGNL